MKSFSNQKNNFSHKKVGKNCQYHTNLKYKCSTCKKLKISQFFSFIFMKIEHFLNPFSHKKINFIINTSINIDIFEYQILILKAYMYALSL